MLFTRASRFIGRWVAPLFLAVVLFGLNNLAVLGGLVDLPEGYIPTFMIRDADIAQYLTWLKAFQRHLLIPDYQAPWLTEPAFCLKKSASSYRES